jgi:phospholipase C
LWTSAVFIIQSQRIKGKDMSMEHEFCDGCNQHCKLGAVITANANWIITTKPTINNKILFGYYDEKDNFKLIKGNQAVVRQEKDNNNVEIALNKSKKEAIKYAQICAKQYLDYTKRAIFLNEVVALQLHK